MARSIPLEAGLITGGGSKSRSNYSVGYSNSASWGSYSISAQRSWDEYSQTENSIYLSFRYLSKS